jgi:hypothetical protein
MPARSSGPVTFGPGSSPPPGPPLAIVEATLDPVTISGTTATGIAGYQVAAGVQYTAIASVRGGAAAPSRSFTIGLSWYASSGALISTSTGVPATDNTTVWTPGSVTATAPAGAAFAAVVVSVLNCTPGETHWFQKAAILLGSSTTWGQGGFVGMQQAIVLRSDGLYVRGASIVNPGPLAPATQQIVLNDYEALPTVQYSYSAQVIVTFLPTANAAVLSPTGTSGNVTLTTTAWWHLDPTNPSSAVSVNAISWNPVQTEQSAAHSVMGAPVATVVANQMMNQDFNAQFEIFTTANYVAFENLLTSQKTVFISSPWGALDSGYFRIGPQPGGMSSGQGNKAKDTQLLASVASGAHRMVAVTAIAQFRPAV